MCLQEEWDKITSEILHHLVSSMQDFKAFKCCQKEWNHYKVAKALLFQFFLNVLQAHKTNWMNVDKLYDVYEKKHEIS